MILSALVFDFAHQDSSKYIDCTDVDLLDVDPDRSDNNGMLEASVNTGGGGDGSQGGVAGTAWD